MAIVLSWNVAGRVRALPAQAAALADQPADVVALQEIRLSSVGPWREHLARLGFTHARTSFDDLDTSLPQAPDRRLGVLVAARGPVELLPSPGVPWPERVLAARVELDGISVEFLNLHSPVSSKRDRVKVRTLESVCAHLAVPSELPRVLAGDLNTPQYESRAGEVRSFARTRTGRIREGFDERHDLAELGILIGLFEHGYRDAFRELHGYERRDRSWLYPHGKMGYRLDHILVRALGVSACEYRHDWRDQRLSDHAAIWAEIGAA
jgi:endonuclease/exonuclease/phosphatase family metal-dependent hydrolase